MAYLVIANDALLSVAFQSADEAGADAVGGACGGYLGSKIGGLIAGALEKRKAAKSPTPSAPIRALSQLTGIHFCAVADLPAELRSSPDWPEVEQFRPVTIFPRLSISSVKASVWRGLVVQVAGKTYPIAIQMWELGKAKRHLAEAMYPLI